MTHNHGVTTYSRSLNLLLCLLLSIRYSRTGGLCRNSNGLRSTCAGTGLYARNLRSQLRLRARCNHGKVVRNLLARTLLGRVLGVEYSLLSACLCLDDGIVGRYRGPGGRIVGLPRLLLRLPLSISGLSHLVVCLLNSFSSRLGCRCNGLLC